VFFFWSIKHNCQNSRFSNENSWPPLMKFRKKIFTLGYPKPWCVTRSIRDLTPQGRFANFQQKISKQLKILEFRKAGTNILAKNNKKMSGWKTSSKIHEKFCVTKNAYVCPRKRLCCVLYNSIKVHAVSILPHPHVASQKRKCNFSLELLFCTT